MLVGGVDNNPRGMKIRGKYTYIFNVNICMTALCDITLTFDKMSIYINCVHNMRIIHALL